MAARMRRVLLGVRRVLERYDEVGGNALAASLTLATFLSLIPLVVVAIAVLGFVASGTPDLADDLIDALGLSGTAADLVRDAIDQARRSRRSASVVGLVSLLFTGLGLANALQHLHAAVWQRQRRGWRARLYAAGWLALVGVVFLAGFALTATQRFLPAPLVPLTSLVGLAVGVAVLCSTVVLIPHPEVRWRDLLPAAVAGALAMEVLKAIGAIWVPVAVSRSSGIYGPVGTVFALLVWLLVFGRLVVLIAVANVVRWEAGHGTSVRTIALPRGPGADHGVTRGGLAAAPRPRSRR